MARSGLVRHRQRGARGSQPAGVVEDWVLKERSANQVVRAVEARDRSPLVPALLENQRQRLVLVGSNYVLLGGE